MSWKTLTTTEKAILFLVYQSENEVKASKGVLGIIGGKKRKGPVTLGQLVTKKTQSSYKDLVKICQGLEDRDYLIAGQKKGRDEPYWPADTPLRLVAKGLKFVQTNLAKYEEDTDVQKELAKLAQIEYEPTAPPKRKPAPSKKPSSKPRDEELEMMEDVPPRKKKPSKSTSVKQGKFGSMASEEFDVDDDYDEDKDREDDAWDVHMGEDM